MTPLGVPKRSMYTHIGREQNTKVPQPIIPLFGICMFSNLKPHTASEVVKLKRHTRNKLRHHDQNDTQITGQLHWQATLMSANCFLMRQSL